MSNLRKSLVFAVRSLSKSPGFSCIAILALGLGIGANTAIFSGVRALLLGPMPYRQPERLVAVWEDASKVGFPRNTPAVANYTDWLRLNHVFSDMAAVRFASANLRGDRPETVMGRGATANLFDVLGAHPLLGRSFTEQEDRAGAKVVVIGSSLAERRFGGAHQALGAKLVMNEEPFTVIGVMGPGFAFPDRRYEFWRPAHFTPTEQASRGRHFLNVVARLKQEVTVVQAQSDMTAIAQNLARQYPDTNSNVGVVIVPLRDQLVGDTRAALLTLMIAAGVVLLIACTNVANLLLIRGAERRHELAIRAALGAARAQIIRQLSTESMVLCAAGTALGLLISLAGMEALQALIPPELVNSTTLTTDWPVLCFAILLSLFSCLLFGLLPVVRSSRLDLCDALKHGGRTITDASGRLRGFFVTAQVALALVLLTGTGMLIQTLDGLRALNLGFPVDHLLTMATPLSPNTYDSDPKILSFSDRVVAQVLRIPGVRAAGFASDMPFTSVGDTSGFQIEGRAASLEDRFNDALYREVSGGYMTALGPRLMEGRLLDQRDTADTQFAVVINETFARRYWPGRSPLGARIRIGGSPDSKAPVRNIVGVVDDIRERGLQVDLKPAVYLPFTQVRGPSADYLLVRTTLDPETVSAAVQNAIRSIDSGQPVSNVRTMQDYVVKQTAGRDLQARVLAIFAALALFLAAIGIYGVLAYVVAQRRREIGIRLAFGADATSVAGLVLRQGLALTGAGLVLGSVLAAAGTRGMSGLLAGVKPLNPLAILAAAAILLFSAMLACLAPSITAARVDPAGILRQE
jgi:putative ABC transport system permease protein